MFSVSVGLLLDVVFSLVWRSLLANHANGISLFIQETPGTNAVMIEHNVLSLSLTVVFVQ